MSSRMHYTLSPRLVPALRGRVDVADFGPFHNRRPAMMALKRELGNPSYEGVWFETHRTSARFGSRSTSGYFHQGRAA